MLTRRTRRKEVQAVVLPPQHRDAHALLHSLTGELQDQLLVTVSCVKPAERKGRRWEQNDTLLLSLNNKKATKFDQLFPFHCVLCSAFDAYQLPSRTSCLPGYRQGLHPAFRTLIHSMSIKPDPTSTRS